MIIYLVSGENDINQKILYGLERIGEIFRILAWKESLSSNINPTQLGLLFLLLRRGMLKIKDIQKITSLDKTTLSKSIKTLEKKKLIKKVADSLDKRNKLLSLTHRGEKLILKLDRRLEIFEPFVESFNSKEIIYHFLVKLIYFALEKKIIQEQRMCFFCKFFESKPTKPYCLYLKISLEPLDLQLDCQDFQPRQDS